MTRDEFVSLLIDNLPREFVRAVPLEVETVYRQAHEEVGANPLVDGPESRSYEGITRFVYMSKRMRELAAAHGLKVANLRSGSYEFSVLIAGPLAVTVASLRDELLPSAHYREWLAALNDAKESPELPYPGAADAATILAVNHYAVLYHRRDSQRAVPSEIGFGRPTTDDSTFDVSITVEALLTAYRANTAAAPAEVPDNVQPKPRRREKEGSDEK
jgi:hypothetical protein